MSVSTSSIISARTATSDASSDDGRRSDAPDALESTDSVMVPADSEDESDRTSDEPKMERSGYSRGEEFEADENGLVVYVKGNPKSQELRDCVYCHRVLLILEEKQIPYTLKWIDPRHKPDWMTKIMPSGHLPLVQDGEEFISESEEISDFLNSKFPEPMLPDDEEGMSAGGGIFAAFRRFIRNRNPNKDKDLRERLEEELESMDQYLTQAGGPFFGGTSFSTADTSLLPRLYRMEIALGHFKKWSLPETCPKVKAYLEAAKKRSSFIKTACSESEVVDTWKLHLLLD